MNINQKLSNYVSLKSLTRTPSGQIYCQDLKSIFSILLFCLELKDGTENPKSTLAKFSFKKQYPYSFSVEQAIKSMEKLHIDLQYNLTSTSFNYEMKNEFSFELLKLFYTAKLLHCPEDKTCRTLKSRKMILQPTPKGVAILHQFCVKMGISNIKDVPLPEILKSNFNSMQLVEFDRHFRSDGIIHNIYSDELLFVRVMGPKMNIWSAKNDAELIPNLGSALLLKPKIDDLEIHRKANDVANCLDDGSAFLTYLRQRQLETRESDTEDPILQNGNPSIQISGSSKLQISPFHHRFFTNPDSDSHIQYYVSNKGLRFFQQKSIKVHGHEITIDRCFSGKALIQYLMDCTDIIYLKDAIELANSFLTNGLIECKFAEARGFSASKNTLYILTRYSEKLTKWYSKSEMPLGEDDLCGLELEKKLEKDVNLNKMLKDPGLKLLFRNFMVENMCVENLNIYDDITDFQKKITVLKKMMSLKDKEKKKVLREFEKNGVFDEPKLKVLKHKKLTIYTAINKLSEYCLSKVYNIFVMYLSEDAPNEINIDSKLRLQVQNYISSRVAFDSNTISVSDLKLRLDLGLPSTHKLSDQSHTNDVNYAENTSYENFNSATTTVEKTDFRASLALDLKHLRDIEKPASSPTEVLFGPKLKFLEDMSVFYEEVKWKTFRMMETDSYGKFLNSDQFKQRNFS